MRAALAVLVAAFFLYGVDQVMNNGLYSDQVFRLIRYLGASFGIGA